MKRRSKQEGSPARRGTSSSRTVKRNVRSKKVFDPHYLFDDWRRVARRLHSAKNVAIFLDFDGTLTPLCRRPEEVWLDPPTRRRLFRLAHLPRVKIWIVSGRRRKDLQRRVNVEGVSYLGLHGWEQSSSGAPKGKLLSTLRDAKHKLTRDLAPFSNIRIEDKRFGLAVHYRDAAGRVIPYARRAVRRTTAQSPATLRILRGKKVWEVLPIDNEGKGKAVRTILADIGESVFPIYLGDDATDEDAFAELPKGLTVRVGPPRRTHARYWLRSPAEVKEFLTRMDLELSQNNSNSHFSSSSGSP